MPPLGRGRVSRSHPNRRTLSIGFRIQPGWSPLAKIALEDPTSPANPFRFSPF